MTEFSNEEGCIRRQLEALSMRLYHLEHRARFIADLAGAASPGQQVNDLRAESVLIVFYEFSEELEAVKEGLNGLAGQSPIYCQERIMTPSPATYRITEDQYWKLYTARHLARVLHDLTAAASRGDRFVETQSESLAVVFELIDDLVTEGIKQDDQKADSSQ